MSSPTRRAGVTEKPGKAYSGMGERCPSGVGREDALRTCSGVRRGAPARNTRMNKSVEDNIVGGEQTALRGVYTPSQWLTSMSALVEMKIEHCD